MFSTKQSLTGGVVTTVGTTLALGIGTTVPASAAQLNFDFTTARQNTGSFTLETSIPDSEPTTNVGLFQNAITNFEFEGARYDAPIDLSAVYSDFQTSFFAVGNNPNGDPFNPLFNINLFFSGNIADDLPDNPANYIPSPQSFDGRVGFFGGYGGGFEVGGIADNDSRITSVSVTAVPEPSTTLGFGIALGFGALIKSQHSKKLNKAQQID